MASVDTIEAVAPDAMVFRALADPTRRLLLDRLFVEDGQSLSALCNAVPVISRFGVMKHLRVLEEAGLVVSSRQGRFRHHYLNVQPIRVAFDDFVYKYVVMSTVQTSGSAEASNLSMAAI